MKRTALLLSLWVVASAGCADSSAAKSGSQNDEPTLPPPYVSQVWVSDNGEGTYTNPIIDADYSDPDICRVGDDYYMTASSFSCVPGLPILHSKDLVNWTLVNYAIKDKYTVEGGFDFSQAQHGNGVWAPSIRFQGGSYKKTSSNSSKPYHGTYHILWGDPDAGIFMVTSPNPEASWSRPQLLKAGKGLIDPCPIWDEHGNMYVVHGYAGSRAGMKSVLGLFCVGSDRESRIIYDGHPGQPTIEGPKFYRKDGYYYIFAPAGGVATGWQLVLRSKDIYGPYEEKIVMAQGSTDINGPHQGGWVDTPDGLEDWFVHFQDKFAYGRVVHLQPMKWTDGWPVIGLDPDGDGCGEPVRTHAKPNVGATYPVATPVESDEFDSRTLGLQWQWHANVNPLWYYCASERSTLRLFSAAVPESYKNLYDVPNLLLQKTPADEFTATMKLDFTPIAIKPGERTGLLVMGLDYALLSLEHTRDGLVLSQNECIKADRGTAEKVNQSVTIEKGQTLYLRVEVRKGAMCKFYYSTDNDNFIRLGKEFKAREGKWIGAKVGTFVTRPYRNNDSGWVDIDWFRITR